MNVIPVFVLYRVIYPATDFTLFILALSGKRFMTTEGTFVRLLPGPYFPIQIETQVIRATPKTRIIILNLIVLPAANGANFIVSTFLNRSVQTT
jgi:hypothetical protein